MEVAKVIDYAYPTMMAEKALKNLHDAMLEQDYDEALRYALIAHSEAKMAYNAILIQKEKQHG